MEDDKRKHLQNKMEDYRRFALTLLSLSCFLYVGLLIPDSEKTTVSITVLLVMVAIALLSAFFFLAKSVTYHRQLFENDEK